MSFVHKNLHDSSQVMLPVLCSGGIPRERLSRGCRSLEARTTLNIQTDKNRTLGSHKHKTSEKKVTSSEAILSHLDPIYLSDTDCIPNADNNGAFDTSFDFCAFKINLSWIFPVSFVRDFHPGVSTITDVPQWRACCRCPGAPKIRTRPPKIL